MDLTARFHALGLWLYRHRRAVVMVWVGLLVLAIALALQAPKVLKGGAAPVHGSGSEQVARLLSTEFDNPYRYSAIVAIDFGEGHSLREPAAEDALAALQEAAGALPFVPRTLSYLDQPDARLLSDDGRRTFFVAGLRADDQAGAEKTIEPLRAALAKPLAAARAGLPALDLNVTGEQALAVDGAADLAHDTETAEKRIVPLVVAFLLLAFGSVAAAGVPVLLGFGATMLSLALLFGIGHLFTVSFMAQSIASMVGLGIGIDYSLIVVSRFREALKTHEGDVEAAVAETTATAGLATLYSGATVMIGMLALFIPNLLDTSSLALAGSVTVFASVALSVTLLPALLGFVGRYVDWPFGFSQWVARFDSRAFWDRWSRRVMRRPAVFLAAGLVLLLVLAVPVSQVRFGQFDSRFFPRTMEAARGVITLEKMGQAGEIYPMLLVVKREDGAPIVRPDGLRAVAGIVRDLQAEPVVARVDSIVQNAGPLILMNNLFFGGDFDKLRARFPEGVAQIVSKDGSATVITVVPRTDIVYADYTALTRRLQTRAWRETPGLKGYTVAVGGAPAGNVDYQDAIVKSLPWLVGAVFGLTCVLLYLSFRSVLLPLKALVMNALSTLSSLGLLVLVFQQGVGHQLIGLPDGLGVMLVFLPVIIFGCVFGMSMDYEVFLVSRIQEAYLRLGKNRPAVAEGLAATGGIITKAAIIMLLVFGAFIGANNIVTKMLGFGLAAAVLVDALIIRMLMVPSFMALFGKWNWWPNVVEPKPSPRSEKPEPEPAAP